MLNFATGVNVGLLLALLILSYAGMAVPASSLWFGFFITAGLSYLALFSSRSSDG